MAKPVPFRYITGLDPKAQREIERDFLSLQQQIVAATSATIYDAIIDPALTVSSPSTHFYKNLSDLIANETLVSTRTFTCGVVPRHTAVITETGAMTLNGPFAIMALGRAGDASNGMYSPG